SGNHLSIEGTTNLTVGSNILIHGQNGTIGSQDFIGGAYTLTNNGTISVDVSGGTIAISPTGTFTNNGLVNAQAGTININHPVQGSGGTLQVGATGTLNLQGVGANSTGNLFHNGNGAGSLNLGTNNITVNTDYNNANFGAGNAFNKRANV